MATFLLSSMESCGGGHGLCHYLLEKEVCPSNPKKEIPTPKKKKRRLTMAISLLSSVESREGGHGLRHHLLDGHLLPFLSRKLWRWSWHIF